MKQALYTIALATPFVAALAWAVGSASAMPDVHVSYATGKCVKVVNYTDTNYTCDNYPRKFNHVWVQ